jgi:hypothetical protein
MPTKPEARTVFPVGLSKQVVGEHHDLFKKDYAGFSK